MINLFVSQFDKNKIMEISTYFVLPGFFRNIDLERNHVSRSGFFLWLENKSAAVSNLGLLKFARKVSNLINSYLTYLGWTRQVLSIGIPVDSLLLKHRWSFVFFYTIVFLIS
jgi:hypothetical protein